jgi:hypothetical protein
MVRIHGPLRRGRIGPRVVVAFGKRREMEWMRYDVALEDPWTGGSEEKRPAASARVGSYSSNCSGLRRKGPRIPTGISPYLADKRCVRFTTAKQNH